MSKRICTYIYIYIYMFLCFCVCVRMPACIYVCRCTTIMKLGGHSKSRVGLSVPSGKLGLTLFLTNKPFTG